MKRRGFLLGALAAPLVAKAGSLMPVRPMPVFSGAALCSSNYVLQTGNYIDAGSIIANTIRAHHIDADPTLLRYVEPAWLIRDDGVAFLEPVRR